MQAVEGITRLIAVADERLALNSTYGTESPQFSSDEEQLQLAVAITQAMLNTALPVARFRCFVKYESGREEGREFTLCAVNIEDIVAALVPLTKVSRQIYLTLWEQRSTGADMLQGFQGWTRTPGKRPLEDFLNLLRRYSASTLAN